MTQRTFAPWVEPIARAFRQQRAELTELVRAIPAEAWDRPSPNERWTYRDLLGHLATRDPRDLRIVLQAVVTKTPLDAAQLSPEEEKPINDRLLGELQGKSIDEVANAIEADTEAILDLLAKLRVEDEHLRQAEFPMNLGEALTMMPQHERMHMDQLRTAAEAPA